MTRLLKEAEESGATTVTGLEMFIGQAYEQYEKYTGLPGKLTLKCLIGYVPRTFWPWFVVHVSVACTLFDLMVLTSNVISLI